MDIMEEMTTQIFDSSKTLNYILPNVISNTFKSGSLSIYLKQNDNGNGRSLVFREIILEPTLPNVEKMQRISKEYLIMEKIKKYPLEVDLKISFFYSYSKLIPQNIINELNSDYSLDWIAELDNIPSVKCILLDDTLSKLPKCIIDLLYWLIVGFKKPKITELSKIEEKWTMEKLADNTNDEPFVICKLLGNTPKNDTNESGIKRTSFGYLHVDSFDIFSMLYNWKMSAKYRCFLDKFHHAYGFGTLQQTWPKCSFGKWIKILFVIEYYMHPSISYVGDLPGTSLSLCLDLTSPDPPGYFLITNTNYARISHILLYKNNYSHLYTAKRILKFTIESFSGIFLCFFGAITLARILKHLRLNNL